MHFRLLLIASGFALVVVASACQVQGSVKGSANANEAREESTFSANAPSSPPTAPGAGAAPAPGIAVTAPPTDACPLTCYEAQGSQRVNVTAEEQTQLRSALEPVLGRMRGCTSPEYWRRHGSPVINLRIAPDGTLADLGVDPHHGREDRSFDDRTCEGESGRGGNVSVALPGRKVVRCFERCVRESTRSTRPTRPTNATQTPRLRDRR